MNAVDFAALPAFRVGHAQDLDAKTGCTVILCPQGAVCGVDVRGGSPATRDTDALHPTANRKHVHAILLTGGSSFGLAAADGVMRFLEQQRIGRDVGVTKIPNVVAAALFDLKCGRSDVRPDAAMGVAACEHALLEQPVQLGGYGAGAGASIGKSYGMECAMPGGVGAALLRQGALLVGAVAAVNCVGDVVRQGEILAGARDTAGRFLDCEAAILRKYAANQDFFTTNTNQEGENTILVCVMTNANLNKAEMTRIAAQGQNGIARAVRPAHSLYDGDVVFAASSGEINAGQDAVGILAARAVEEAVQRAVVG
ncbi:MAG: P1 family peptidase [Oscillospiraceae bacterium]|jgi:L-aminopeptidase/D-esterase-like protein|nr:P1 family peptidase [Oscillospiraceae bacterium]